MDWREETSTYAWPSGVRCLARVAISRAKTRQPSGPPSRARFTHGLGSRCGARVGRYGGFERMRSNRRRPFARSVRTVSTGSPSRRARCKTARSAAGFRSVATTRPAPRRAEARVANPRPHPTSSTRRPWRGRANRARSRESSRTGYTSGTARTRVPSRRNAVLTVAPRIPYSVRAPIDDVNGRVDQPWLRIWLR